MRTSYLLEVLEKEYLSTQRELRGIEEDIEYDKENKVDRDSYFIILREIQLKTMQHELKLIMQEIKKENDNLGNPDIINDDKYIEGIKIKHRIPFVPL